MPATFQSAGANASSATITIPSHQADDIIIIVTYASSDTKPSASGTVPTWNKYSWDAPLGVYWAKATASNHTSGSWNTASGCLAVTVWRGADLTTPIATKANNVNSSAQPQAPSITLADTSGNAGIQHTYFPLNLSGSTQTWSSAPGGYTSRASVNAGAYGLGVRTLTKDSTTSDGAVTNNMSAAPYNSSNVSLEIKPAVADSHKFFAMF